MRILETSELRQVSGAGLLGLGLNLNLLDLVGIKTRVSVGGGDCRSGGRDRGCERREPSRRRHCY